MKFEEKIKELEKIVNNLENNNQLSLEESIVEFEKGIAISKECSEYLKQAEQKIKILIKDGENVVEEDF